MTDYIRTYTGVAFVSANPRPEDFRIEDIAHALSLICRGNGHVKTFWSVGEHCIACAKEAAARGLADRIVLACLLHDAGECYLSDVPRPVKKTLPAYQETENRLLAMIYQKFLGSDLTDEEAVIVKKIDDDLLWYDLTELLNEPHFGKAPELHICLSYNVRPFSEVEEEFLCLFEQYSGKDIVEKAKLLAQKQFMGRTDKSGVDYYSGHLSSVAGLVSGEKEKTVAYLHDILEDTDYPEEKLREEFGDEITDAVVLLTHKGRMNEGQYLDYIRRLASSDNRLAVHVKIADLTNNSDTTRLGASCPEELAEKDRNRWEKYQKALQLLTMNMF